MKRFWCLLVASPLFAAGLVPGRYIVELSSESVAAHVNRVSPRRFGPLALSSADAEQHRRQVRTEQAAAASEIQAAGGEIAGAAETISNVLFVRIAEDRAARLASIPGVRAVYPERLFRPFLDHALPLHHVPEAWAQIGAGRAGEGVRIAIIDSGIDISHPGFQDASFQAPAGFPRANTDSDLAFTNQKVIVARSYASLFARRDPDPSAADHSGHGTATAMAAAGVMNTGPLATISGVAPRAYLGSYKVFGTPGVNDSATESAILKAIDDAVNDGMDVISLSLGSNLAPLPANDPEVKALKAAADLGTIVVAAAGNGGPDPATVGSPASGPFVIAVGASANERIFAASVLVPGSGLFAAAPGSASGSAAPVTAMVVDVAQLDGTGLACNPLPPNSLSGAIALILRGQCTFETKLNNAQAAGAAGGLVYDNIEDEPLFTMAVGSAKLPADLIAYRDGLALKQWLNPAPARVRQPAARVQSRSPKPRPSLPLQVTLQFEKRPVAVNPARMATFSAVGPNVDLTIKPDLVAVGLNLYTAAEKLDPKGLIYDSSGYSVQQGTSFSTPLVAGAAALLKAARPGLSGDQYRSLLVNSADVAFSVPSTPATVQQAGGGVLNLLRSLNAAAAVTPPSLSFSAGDGTVQAVTQFTLSNVGTASDTFRLAVTPSNGAAAPTVSDTAIDLAPGKAREISVQFSASGLAAGSYEGFITIQGTRSNIVTRVPYWYGVRSTTPGHITVLENAGDDSPPSAGAIVNEAIIFRVSDPSGIPIQASPVVTALSGGGAVLALRAADSLSPYAFAVTVRMGARPGDNVFRIQVGSLTKDVTITGQ